jgi:hypothetical protein
VRDVAKQKGSVAEVATRIRELRRAHASKQSLLRHLAEAGFDAVSLRQLS